MHTRASITQNEKKKKRRRPGTSQEGAGMFTAGMRGSSAARHKDDSIIGGCVCVFNTRVAQKSIGEMEPIYEELP